MTRLQPLLLALPQTLVKSVFESTGFFLAFNGLEKLFLRDLSFLEFHQQLDLLIIIFGLTFFLRRFRPRSEALVHRNLIQIKAWELAQRHLRVLAKFVFKALALALATLGVPLSGVSESWRVVGKLRSPLWRIDAQVLKWYLLKRLDPLINLRIS